MKRVLITTTALMLTGCGGTKVAENYAAKMGEVLKTYREQVDVKIRAEQQSYIDLAQIYDAANTERIKQSMLLDRNKRAVETTDRLVRAKAANPAARAAFLSQIHNDIEQFATADFQQMQAVYTRELDSYKQSLEGLADLAVEQENLDNLKNTLADLAQPKNLVEQLKATGQFGCEINRNYQLLETNRQIDDLAKAIAAESDATKQTSLAKQKTDLETQKTKLQTPCKVG